MDAFRIPFCISFHLRLPIPEILKQKLGSFHFQGSLCLRRLLSWMMFYVIAEARTGPLAGKRRHWMLPAADAEEATKSWTPKSSNEHWALPVMARPPRMRTEHGRCTQLKT